MIEITEKNYKQIFGRVKKFFKGYKAFETWSSYDCGGSKRIPHTFKMDGEVYNTKLSILRQATIYDKIDFIGIQYFCGVLEGDNYYFLEIGDEISFIMGATLNGIQENFNNLKFGFNADLIRNISVRGTVETTKKVLLKEQKDSKKND